MTAISSDKHRTWSLYWQVLGVLIGHGMDGDGLNWPWKFHGCSVGGIFTLKNYLKKTYWTMTCSISYLCKPMKPGPITFCPLVWAPSGINSSLSLHSRRRNDSSPSTYYQCSSILWICSTKVATTSQPLWPPPRSLNSLERRQHPARVKADGTELPVFPHRPQHHGLAALSAEV